MTDATRRETWGLVAQYAQLCRMLGLLKISNEINLTHDLGGSMDNAMYELGRKISRSVLLSHRGSWPIISFPSPFAIFQKIHWHSVLAVRPLNYLLFVGEMDGCWINIRVDVTPSVITGIVGAEDNSAPSPIRVGIHLPDPVKPKNAKVAAVIFEGLLFPVDDKDLIAVLERTRLIALETKNAA